MKKLIIILLLFPAIGYSQDAKFNYKRILQIFKSDTVKTEIFTDSAKISTNNRKIVIKADTIALRGFVAGVSATDTSGNALYPVVNGKVNITNATINTSSNSYVLATNRGSNGQYLKTDGSGNTSWSNGTTGAHDSIYFPNVGWTVLPDTTATTDLEVALKEVDSLSGHYSRTYSLIDDSYYNIKAAKAGRGSISVINSSDAVVGYADFYFNADGTVYNITSTSNVIYTDTDTYIAIFDAGTNVRVRNRLAATHTLLINLSYKE